MIQLTAVVRPLAVGLLLTTALPTFAHAIDPKVFETPEAAATAMVTALEKGNDESIIELLGDSHNDELFTDDEAAEHENRKKAHMAAREAMSLREDDADTRTILIGKQAWPVPFPIIRGDKGWSFDIEAGLYELLARRIGANELATIASLRSLVDAQEDYKALDRDGDEVLEYAQRIVSSSGKKDGLYWDVAGGSTDPASPLIPFITQQGGYLEGREQGDPLRGYNFRIMTRQGESVPGGRYDYIINGNMIGGFAVLATPDDYGVTGIMTFMVNQLGKVYERDLGDDTELKAAAIQEYDVDENWTLSKE
jgi:hypothetical protein